MATQRFARLGILEGFQSLRFGRPSAWRFGRPSALPLGPRPDVNSFGLVRTYYRFARPASPKLDELRKVLTERLTPVHFFLKNDLCYANWVYDMHFTGIMCSPKFEGKSYKEIHDMVNACCAEVGMEGRVRMICQPPSRWHMMRKRARKRWNLDM
mmetsp:Transcript_126196/g.200156  ORF Transcript_126196/g.200156 Transcript_126196/m.200156 type:complete len:155 (+) Transcript_126196:70-534(+)